MSALVSLYYDGYYKNGISYDSVLYRTYIVEGLLVDCFGEYDQFIENGNTYIIARYDSPLTVRYANYSVLEAPFYADYWGDDYVLFDLDEHVDIDFFKLEFNDNCDTFVFIADGFTCVLDDPYSYFDIRPYSDCSDVKLICSNSSGQECDASILCMHYQISSNMTYNVDPWEVSNEAIEKDPFAEPVPVDPEDDLVLDSINLLNERIDSLSESVDVLLVNSGSQTSFLESIDSYLSSYIEKKSMADFGRSDRTINYGTPIYDQTGQITGYNYHSEPTKYPFDVKLEDLSITDQLLILVLFFMLLSMLGRFLHKFL